MTNDLRFEPTFLALTGNEPFPWQRELYRRLLEGDWSRLSACDIPTGLGKTAIIPIWLIALGNRAPSVPRRLVYVVNRRTVVDQATSEAERLREKLQSPEGDNPTPDTVASRRQLSQALSSLSAIQSSVPLAISTLRGQFADNREWSADPARPAIIVGTVDMIGSRLLFGGYGLGFKTRPLHAGFLGHDALLVHDEAHLEPAFQKLIEAVRDEQAREGLSLGEEGRLRVIALTATPRGRDVFQLSDEDQNYPAVRKRLSARKRLHLHEYDDEKKLPERLAELALAHRDTNRTVIVFARAVKDLESVVQKLRKENPGQVKSLTGTLRGKERDALLEDPVFRRFLPGAPEGEAPAYLVCTSAGEVGVNISADHLACDLSTYESMAQRFGRVNRFGDREDTRIDVLHPKEFNADDTDSRRAKTLGLLRSLDGDANPAALACLDPEDRLAAFSRDPVFLHASDILFDTWALTSIREDLPGRPPVEPYLHGLTDREPPVTEVAWREEVKVISSELRGRYKPEDLLEAYPLKPHELLRDRSDRVFKQLAVIAQRCPEEPAWLIDHDGSVQVLTLQDLADKDRKNRIENRTVLLTPSVGGLEDGFLQGSSRTADDVADDWLDEQKNKRRERRWDDEPPERMRLVLTIDKKPDALEIEDADEDESKRFWRWYVKPQSADDDVSKTARQPVLWKVHTEDVQSNTSRIVRALHLPERVSQALICAAELHDYGKQRALWQKSIGNHANDICLAKAGSTGRGRWSQSLDFGSLYRHEFGSLLDAEAHPGFQELDDEQRDLVLHLIAAHHGRGRPHFGPDEVFDPERPQNASDRVAAEVPQRFARLQQKNGRWGLAYLESLLRAADYAASAEPSKTLDEELK